MKALNYDEWLDGPPIDWNGVMREENARIVWDAARVGTIPEDGAVRIPPVSEWPEDAHYISVHFRTRDDGFAGVAHEDITKPVPEWTPKVGEAVFANQNGYLCTGMVHAVHEGGINVSVGGLIRDYPRHLVKPFDASKIGKPWQEI